MTKKEQVMKKLCEKNINNPPIRVAHKTLPRLSEDSAFKSACPVCKKGILPVSRNQSTFRLIDEDQCLLCGQQFIYTDLDYLRKQGW